MGSGIMEEAVTIVVTDVEATSQLYFDSLEIETDVRCPMSGGKPKKNCLRLFGDKKGVYEPVQAETDGSKLYCLTSASKTATGGFSVGSPGTAGGSPIKFGKWSGIKEYNTYGQQAPGCITMRKTSPTDYIISAGDNRMKFFFSSKRKPASADAEKNLVCIYPTQTPRCADVFGALRNMDTYEVACDESNGGESACTDAAYDGTCRGMKMEGACGEAKTTLDILKCCDKNGNKAGSGCTNSRRRLAAAAPKRHPANPTWVYEKDAEPCAKKCRTLGEGAPGEKGKCVAWRLEKTLTGETHCILSTKCYPGKHPVAKDKQLEVKKWYAFKGSNPFSATPPKKVRKPKRKL